MLKFSDLLLEGIEDTVKVKGQYRDYDERGRDTGRCALLCCFVALEGKWGQSGVIEERRRAVGDVPAPLALVEAASAILPGGLAEELLTGCWVSTIVVKLNDHTDMSREAIAALLAEHGY